MDTQELVIPLDISHTASICVEAHGPPLMLHFAAECMNLLLHVFTRAHPQLSPGFHFSSRYSNSSYVFSRGPEGENVVL